MKIREKGKKVAQYLGVENAAMFESNGRYCLKLARPYTLESGLRVDAVWLDTGELQATSPYASVYDMQDCTLVVEANKGADHD